MKALKTAGIILLVLVVVVAGLVFYGLRNLDDLVQTAVERFGSETTRTQVTLDSVNIELGDGRAELGDFQVGNPEGYQSDYALALNQALVQLAPESVTGDPVVLREINVDGASIIAELRSLSESNLRELTENVRGEGGTAEEPPPEGEQEYTGPNFRVEQFQFSNADIQVVGEQFQDQRLDMPTVTADNLGGEQGLPPQELAAALLSAVLEQASAAVRDELEGAAQEELRDRAEEELNEQLDPGQQEQLDRARDLLNR